MPRPPMPQTPAAPAPAPEGFHEVTAKRYHEVLTPTPGIGRITNEYEYYGRGYIHEWDEAAGRMSRVIAMSYSGDSPFTPKRYFVRADRVAA